MDKLVFLGTIGLCLSALLNVILIYRHYKKPTRLTVDASALLHELTRGKAILKIEVVDPAGLFYRSPKG